MKKIISFLTAFLFIPFRTRISHVLELVNTARHALNLPRIESLPSGVEGRATACPLANALGGMVGVDGICFNERHKALYVAEAWQTRVSNRGQQRYVVDLPAPLRTFVRDFDMGAYRLFA